ncbi:glycosyltransferase family 22 protein [Fistulina hepatica ATCC 64428]|nr:glycosyltransferase family 22 protein [Fistulina hepatica ATCC 64428]
MASVVVAWSLFIRIAIALATRTFFQPDEYFQSLEPAHHAVFGYGHLTWEWLIPSPIRSIVYPALNIPVFWLIKYFGLEQQDWLLIAGPRLLHGTIAALTDIWLCELTRRVLGQRYVPTALFLSLSSFFHALSLSRSLSNSFETSLSTIAFAYFPWEALNVQTNMIVKNDLRLSILFAAVGCMIRPTNAIIWVFLFGRLTLRLLRSRVLRLWLFSQFLLVALLAASVLLIVDSVYYGKLTFTPLNFLRTNASRVSLFYGSNAWHYFLSQAIPILCTTTLPFVGHTLWTTAGASASSLPRNNALSNISGVIAWTIFVYSLFGHKEWRFIHPLLPLFHLLAAKSIVDLSGSCDCAAPPNKQVSERRSLPARKRYIFVHLLNLPAILYVVFIHQSAPISAMSYLRRAISRNGSELGNRAVNDTVGFLMPCHSTPGYAYLHRDTLSEPGAMWALGCEPPLGYVDLLSSTTYKDQTTIFFDDPHTYLESHFPPSVDPRFPASERAVTSPGSAVPQTRRQLTQQDGDSPEILYYDTPPWKYQWPRLLVFYGALVERNDIRALFLQKGYRQVWSSTYGDIQADGTHGPWRWWEGDWGDGSERRGGVQIWEWHV